MPDKIIIRCIDFETTGENTEEEKHAVCEVGWCDVTYHTREHIDVGEPMAIVTNPLRPIPPVARAVHHITDAELVDAPPATAVFVKHLTVGPPNYFCAHNADFERSFFGGGDVPWVCTYKVALRFWPDEQSHGLQVLRYALDLPAAPEKAGPAHRAGPDAYLGALLMERILREGKASLDDMVRWSKGPALLPRIKFGKHKGKRWEDAPTDYLEWIVNKSDLDRDIKANAKHHLKKRAAEHQGAA